MKETTQQISYGRQTRPRTIYFLLVLIGKDNQTAIIILVNHECPTKVNFRKSNFLFVCWQTLNILVNWSCTPFRPGNSGCPHSISTKIQPTPLNKHKQNKHELKAVCVFGVCLYHMSNDVEYLLEPSNTSGGLYLLINTAYLKNSWWWHLLVSINVLDFLTLKRHSEQIKENRLMRTLHVTTSWTTAINQ